MSNLLKTSAIIALATANLVACDRSDSKTKGIGQITTYAAAEAQKPEVLIYYANETNGSSATLQKYFADLSSLANDLKNKTGEPLYGRIADNYSKDLQNFEPQVEKEIGLLLHAICDSGKTDRGLLIFSNKLATQDKYQGCLPKGDSQGNLKMTRIDGKLGVELPAAVANDFRFKEFRLGTPYGLSAAMKVISNLVPATNYRGVLITKSHGDYAHVLVPKLTHDMDNLTKEQLQTHFEEVVAAASFVDQPLVSLKVGDMKIGDLKIGDLKVGDLKIGDLKVADLKIGDLKTGDLKIGELKVGDLKAGDLKIGDLKNGDLKVGDLKVGDLKVGDLKVGDLKTGDLKTSDLKVGDLKVGDLKVGDLKVGDLKTGDLASDATDNLPAGGAQLGIEKSVFLDTLRGGKAKFSLLFLESCNSNLSATDMNDLDFDNAMDGFTDQRVIDAVVTSDDQGLSYQNIDYAAITKDLQEGVISKVIKDYLQKKKDQQQAVAKK